MGIRVTPSGGEAAASGALALVQSLDAEGRHDEAVQELRRVAETGDLAAVTMLAKRVLVGRHAPFAPQDGIALLTKAMEAGHAEAIDQLATLNAAGAWIPQSWDKALDLLQLAAERGGVHAQRQLDLLARESVGAERFALDDPAIWKRLRSLVNVDTWMMPKPPQQILDGPRVWVVENFASAEVCDWLIDRARGKLRPSLMRDVSTGVSKFDAARTCSDFAFDIVESDLILLLLRVRISLATSLPVMNMEPPQIFHYALGQEIKAHYDFLRDGTHGYGSSGSYDGDRLATFLLYLNDDYDGGDLSFPKAKHTHRGKKGDGVFFASYRDGKPDTMSLHAAVPVTRNEKWILSQWIHDRTFAA